MASLRLLLQSGAWQDVGAAQAALPRFEASFFKYFPHLQNRFCYPADLAPAAVLVPVIDRPEGATVLLTYRTDDMPTHPGEIVFPGGGCKAGDTSLVDTALREAEEEIGLARAHIELAGYLDARPMGPRYRVQPVLAIVAAEARFSCCAREVASLFEVPLQFVLNPGNYRQGVNADGELDPDILILHYQHHSIWGATADILWDLRGKIDGVCLLL